ncbi:hypothetical protein BCR43DRAFT_481543 [Syncephalastrum racemosum]|uniref:Uncharacterized protein n=1 Tax=Syncephalastrum racemosum TaxID=13706 RepID=A0A1X2HS97_SYNRA|nr:hypothetical protein BCR43DRAFT_481543 [Syncephalastrum racemosum]
MYVHVSISVKCTASNTVDHVILDPDFWYLTFHTHHHICMLLAIWSIIFSPYLILMRLHCQKSIGNFVTLLITLSMSHA